eukprot:3938147-Rhodomonas_salina.1
MCVVLCVVCVRERECVCVRKREAHRLSRHTETPPPVPPPSLLCPLPPSCAPSLPLSARSAWPALALATLRAGVAGERGGGDLDVHAGGGAEGH